MLLPAAPVFAVFDVVGDDGSSFALVEAAFCNQKTSVRLVIFRNCKVIFTRDAVSIEALSDE